MTHCERCRVHPATHAVASMCVCHPCAELLAYDYRVPIAPLASSAGPAYVGAMPGAGGAAVAEADGKRGDSFPFLRVMFVLGGVAVVGGVVLWARHVFETTQAARRTIEKHPELLTALI